MSHFMVLLYTVYQMDRASDPDFSFFLKSPVVRRTSISRGPVAVFQRGLEWRSRRSIQLDSIRLANDLNRSSMCTFIPEITRRGKSVEQSFKLRLSADGQRREHSRIVSEFIRQQREESASIHPYKPDLSQTRSFRFTQYLSRPIKIPNL